MKTIFALALLCISALFFSCKRDTQDNKRESVTVKTEQHSTENTVTEQITGTPARPAIIDSTHIIRNENGDWAWATLHIRPGDNAPKGNIFPIGKRIYITEDMGEWLKTWDYIAYDENGKYIDKPQEGDLYIRKNLTGNFDNLHVNEVDMYFYSAWVGEEVEKRASEDTLSFRLISKEQYYEKKKSSPAYILYDTLKIIKKNGVITLPCENKTVKLEDIDTDSDNRAQYKYLGQIPDFNAYLIFGQFYESSGYMLFDKTTGENTGSFGEFPALSPDKKLIATIWGNLYDDRTEFAVFKAEAETNEDGQKYFPVLFSYDFTKWLPLHSAYGYENDYFWGDDGYLYIRIQTWHLAGQTLQEESRQYARVKILNAARI